jgi:hypothetical protein
VACVDPTNKAVLLLNNRVTMGARIGNGYARQVSSDYIRRIKHGDTIPFLIYVDGHDGDITYNLAV